MEPEWLHMLIPATAEVVDEGREERQPTGLGPILERDGDISSSMEQLLMMGDSQHEQNAVHLD